MRHYAHWLAIAVVSSLFTIPTALAGFDPGDRIHLAWAHHFVSQLIAGDLLPQWLTGMNSGLGSPTFFFYGPVGYYFTTPFVLIFGKSAGGWTAVGMAAWLATFLSAVFAFLWLRCISSHIAAASAAMVYVVLPYHYRVDYLERFAFAEYWQFAWMPLLLWAVEKRNIAAIGGGYALLLATHPPTALLFAPVPLLYALARRVPIGRAAIGFVLGISLAAVYLLPALFTQGDASIEAMFRGNGDFSRHFLFGETGGTDPMATGRKYFLGRIADVMAYMALLIGLAFAAGSKAQMGQRLFWLLMAGSAGFFCFQVSEPLWQLLPMFQKVQFPWRLLSVITIAGVALLALAVDGAIATRSYWRFGVVALLALLVGWEVVLAKQSVEWAMGRTRTVPAQYNEIDYGEYRPKWVPHDQFTLEGVRRIVATTPQAGVVAGRGTVVVKSWTPRSIILDVNSLEGVKVQLRHYYYPCWIALSGDTTLTIEPAATTGLMVINVPPGDREVALRMDTVPVGQYGRAISASALVLLLAFGFTATGRVSYKSARSSRPIVAAEPEPCLDQPVQPPHDSASPRTRSVA